MRIPLKYNVRSVAERWTTASFAALGIALVTAVFVALLGLGVGMASLFVGTGHPLNVVVLSKSALSETQSGMTDDEAHRVLEEPGIAVGPDGRKLASVEAYLIALLPKISGGEVNATMRGVTEDALRVREGVSFVEGAMFRPGTSEVVVGRTASGRFRNLRMGDTFRVQGREWTVAGIFEDGGSAYESEIWADAQLLRTTFQRGYTTVILRMESREAADALAARLEDDPTVRLKAQGEIGYFAQQIVGAAPIFTLAAVAAILLGIGAAFGAANTMYAAVAARIREIAVMRVLGFRRRDILLSFQLEAAMIALVGGAAGAALAWMAANGVETGTMNFMSFSEVAFAFQVNGFVMLAGVLLALAVGLVGGFAPALRASRLPIVQAIREW